MDNTAFDMIKDQFEKTNKGLKVAKVIDYTKDHCLVLTYEGKTVNDGSVFYAVPLTTTGKIQVFIPTPDDDAFFEALVKRSKDYITEG